MSAEQKEVGDPAYIFPPFPSLYFAGMPHLYAITIMLFLQERGDDAVPSFAGDSDLLRCRLYENQYPEAEEVVMVNVTEIGEMGAYVTLLEYDNIEVRKQYEAVHPPSIMINKTVFWHNMALISPSGASCVSYHR
jgi:hypothetical protein